MIVCTIDGILIDDGRRQSKRVTMTKNTPRSIIRVKGVNKGQVRGEAKRGRLPKSKEKAV